MSLSDAVLAIAEVMETEGGVTPMTFRNYAMQLRIAVKASEGTSNPLLGAALADTQGTAYHRQMIDAAKKQMREEKEKSGVQERDSDQMVEVRGGDLDGTLVSVRSADVQVGKAHILSGAVYVVKRDDDGVWLEFSAEETAKVAGLHRDDKPMNKP